VVGQTRLRSRSFRPNDQMADPLWNLKLDGFNARRPLTIPRQLLSGWEWDHIAAFKPTFKVVSERYPQAFPQLFHRITGTHYLGDLGNLRSK
jgi:hypothetical protein